MILVFVELPLFRNYIDSIPSGQSILRRTQEVILNDPTGGDVIVGTGGLRKIRIARGIGAGKSSGYRVTYLYVPTLNKVYLMVIYAKNEKENLTLSERNQLKVLVEILKGRLK